MGVGWDMCGEDVCGGGVGYGTPCTHVHGHEV